MPPVGLCISSKNEASGLLRLFESNPQRRLFMFRGISHPTRQDRRCLSICKEEYEHGKNKIVVIIIIIIIKNNNYYQTQHNSTVELLLQDIPISGTFHTDRRSLFAWRKGRLKLLRAIGHWHPTASLR